MTLERSDFRTQSPAFRNSSHLDRSEAVFEEMRIFYVAVTRAQNHVILVGGDTGTTLRHNHPEYSWQDETLAARGVLSRRWFYRP